MFNNFDFMTLLSKGGIAVVILAFFSVFSIGVMLERLWMFFKFRKGILTFFPRIQKALKNGGKEAAAALCDSEEPAGRICKAALPKYAEGKTAVAEAMELAARQEIFSLERYLGLLGTVGSTAPFIGLFGTVLGIIRAFHDLAIGEGAGPSVVADGIAEALIATAAGLFVAVPAVIAYNYFTRRLNSIAFELERGSAEFVDLLFEGKK